MSSDSSPPRVSVVGNREHVQGQRARPRRLRTLDRRSFRLRYGDAEAERPRDSAEDSSPFGPERRRSLDRSSFRLRFDDFGDDSDSDEQSSDDEEDFTVSYSRTLPRESHNEVLSSASATTSAG